MSGVNDEVLTKATTASDPHLPQAVLTARDERCRYAETQVPRLCSLDGRPGLGRTACPDERWAVMGKNRFWGSFTFG